MSNLTGEELNEICFRVFQGAAHGMYSWFDYEVLPEEEWEDHMNEGEKAYMRGRGTAFLDLADDLHHLGVDVGYRALTYSEEEDLPLYPVWITDRGYEPHFHLTDSTPESYRVISEEDEEKYYKTDEYPE